MSTFRGWALSPPAPTRDDIEEDEEDESDESQAFLVALIIVALTAAPAVTTPFLDVGDLGSGMEIGEEWDDGMNEKLPLFFVVAAVISTAVLATLDSTGDTTGGVVLPSL